MPREKYFHIWQINKRLFFCADRVCVDWHDEWLFFARLLFINSRQVAHIYVNKRSLPVAKSSLFNKRMCALLEKLQFLSHFLFILFLDVLFIHFFGLHTKKCNLLRHLRPQNEEIHAHHRSDAFFLLNFILDLKHFNNSVKCDISLVMFMSKKKNPSVRKHMSVALILLNNKQNLLLHPSLNLIWEFVKLT